MKTLNEQLLVKKKNKDVINSESYISTNPVNIVSVE